MTWFMSKLAQLWLWGRSMVKRIKPGFSWSGYSPIPIPPPPSPPPPPPPAPPPPPPSGQTVLLPLMTLGTNIIELESSRASCPFNNLIYGGVNQCRLDPFSGGLIPLPSANITNGWASSLPAGGANGGPYVVRELSSPTTTGTYPVTWTGNITNMFLNTPADTATLDSIDYVHRTATLTVLKVIPNSPAVLLLYYTFTDTVNYPQAINVSKSTASGRFTPEFLDSIRHFEGLRFCKWKPDSEGNVISGMETAWAGGTQATPIRTPLWASRNTVTGGDWISYDGVPVEIMVELCNLIKSTYNTNFQYAHFNLEWNVEDAYVTNFSSYTRDNLAVGIEARYELSDEIWNPQYPAEKQAYAEGLAQGLPNRGHTERGTVDSRYAQRLNEVLSLITTVYTGQLTRVNRLVCCQHANAWSAQEIFQYMSDNGWIGKTDTLCTAPYISQSAYPWTYVGDLQVLYDAANTYLTTFVTPDQVTHAATAVTWNKKNSTYESGPSFLFSDPTTQTSFHTDVRMYNLMVTYANWLKDHYQSATWFALEHPLGPTNAWGLKEYESQFISKATTPKFQALIDTLLI